MNKQRVKRAQMPSSLEHLRTFDTDRLRSVASVNMRKKPFCALLAQNERIPNGWSDARARDARSSA